MTKRNATAVRYDGDDFLQGAPGAFRFTTGVFGFNGVHGIYFMCPCGCKSVYGGTFDNYTPEMLASGHKPGGWHWDGDTEKPTVNPSFGCHAVYEGQSKGQDGYHWHGFLRDGIFEEC